MTQEQEGLLKRIISRDVEVEDPIFDLFVDVDAELTTLRAEVDRWTKELNGAHLFWKNDELKVKIQQLEYDHEAERKAIAEQLRYYVREFGMEKWEQGLVERDIDRIIAGEYGKEKP